MLEIHGLCKSYGTFSALSDVSFSAVRGQVTALLGENGAGKSTLVKILSGLQAPTAGKIVLDGRVIDTSSPDRARRAGVAVVQQEISVLPNLTVTENFMLTAGPHWLRRRRTATDCRRHLARLGLGQLDPGRLTGSLTVGERQLVEIARMLAQDAEVLVLDEPTAALGDRDIELVHDAVRRLATEGKVVLYITHRLNELAEICDGVVVLRNGSLAGEFDAADVPLARVIRAMIGRELRELFPPSGGTDAQGGRTSVAIRGLRTAALAGPINLELRPGQIVATCGHLGSGFVEPLRAVAGITPVLDGEILLFGRPHALRSQGARAGAGVGYCSEDRQLDGFFPDRPVWESLTAPALAASGLWGTVNPAQLRRSAASLADRMTLSPAYRTRPVRSLSGGNAQKVSIGKWLSRDPKILLLEEPTRGVDVGARAEIYRMLRALADDGLSILFASSDLEEVLGFGERVLVFHNGRLIRTAPSAAFTRDELTTWVTHGSADA